MSFVFHTQDEAPKDVFVRGQTVKVRTITVSDHKDNIKLSLWRKEANLQLHTGDYIEAKNVVVRAYEGQPQLSSTSRTSIEVEFTVSLQVIEINNLRKAFEYYSNLPRPTPFIFTTIGKNGLM